MLEFVCKNMYARCVCKICMQGYVCKNMYAMICMLGYVC